MTRMPRDSVQSVEDVDKDYLTQIVKKTGAGEATVKGFQRDFLQANSFGGGGIYRFRLDYLEPKPVQVPNSIILKIARPNPHFDGQPGDVCREAQCYQYGLFDGLSQPLYVPKAYHTVMWPEKNECWIWMEDLGADMFHMNWTVPMLQKAVRDLATLHAHWWGRTDELRQLPFLFHRAHGMYQRIYIEPTKQTFRAIDAHPLAAAIKRVYTPAREHLLLKLQDMEDVVYPRLDVLPQTLLHHDVWPPNAAFHDGRTVLIDWAFVGMGTPGADLCILSAFDELINPEIVGRAEELLVETLWQGLHKDQGLPISYDEVLQGYRLGFVLRIPTFFVIPLLMGILAGVSPVANDDTDFSNTEAWLHISERSFVKLEQTVDAAAIF